MQVLLTDLCQSLNNWFDLNSSHEPYGHYAGLINISNGEILVNNKAIDIISGQYIRIVDGILNNGVYEYGKDDLEDETFFGAIWLMVIPISFISLAKDIQAWKDKYESTANSPYSSESTKVYSYTKATTHSGSDNNSSWQSVFKSQLNAWRKLK